MIRKGVNLIPDIPMTKLIELGVEAERLGYDSCWVYDEGLATRDVFISLAAIAQATSSIRLGTGITNPYTRHPAVTACAIATLDELSGGRAFLGLWAGGSLTLGALAIQRNKPLTAVREMLHTVRLLFDSQTVTFDGEMVRMKDARLPVSRYGMEIWIAGRGSKMLTLGGEMASGVVLDFVYKRSMQNYVDLVRKGAKLTGNNPKLCYSTMIITNQRVLEEVRPHMTYRLVDSPDDVKEMIGLTAADTEAIRSTMVSQGLVEAGKLIKDEWILPFVIMGTVQECACELAEIVGTYGFDEFLLPILESHSAVELMSDVGKVLSMA